MLENIIPFPNIIRFAIVCILLGILFIAGIKDMITRTISKLNVMLVYILGGVYYSLSVYNPMQTTMVFVFSLLIFCGIAFLSRGGFGYGDALVIGGLTIVLGTFPHFQKYLYILGCVSLVWAVFMILWVFRKNGYHHISYGFKQKFLLPIDEVKPGMVLASDYFMNSLKQFDIDELKKHGTTSLLVKQPMAFIPVIFFSFLVYNVFLYL